MQKSTLFTAALLALSVAAHADLKVTQTTQIDNPQLKAYMETMTPQQRAAMSRGGGMMAGLMPSKTIVYFSGKKTRADIGQRSVLFDGATRKIVTLNRATHTYATQLYKAPGAGQFQATVKPVGGVKTIQGHPARHYLLTATSASLPGTIIQGDIWAAQDLPSPPSLSGGGPFAATQSFLSKVKGYPLIASIVATGSPMGNTTFKSIVTSVSKAPLPASVFAIPAGYKKAAAGGD